MPIPTNTTPALAIDILALPYNFTNDVTGLSAPYTLWWKRIAQADDVLLGCVAYAQSGALYRPQITFWSGPDANTLTQIDATDFTVGHDTPCQFPVAVGTSYWIKVEDDGFGSAPGILIFDIQPSPSTDPIPAGSLFINDDTESLDIDGNFNGIWAIILDQSTGEVIACARTTVGEEGAILTDGTMMLQNDDAISETAKLYLYDSDFNQITTIALSAGTIQVELAANGLLFYRCERVSPSNDSVIKTYNNIGVVQDTYTVTGYKPICIAVKKDDSIVYMNDGTLAEDVQAFDVNTLSFSPIITGESGKVLGKQALAVLADDSIVAAWSDGASTIVVKIYDDAGIELHSYAFVPPANLSDGPRVAVTDDDETFYWIWASGVVSGERKSKFSKIRVSDGTVLTTFTVNVFESGQGPSESGNVDPAQRFGNSKSCPFLILPVATTPPVANYSGIYTLTTDRLNDELFSGDNSTVEVKIPDPTAILYPAGD